MKKVALYIGFSALAIVLFGLSLRTGILQLHTSFWHLLTHHAGTDATTIWQIRFPRALGAAIIGAGLGIAGSIAQGIFRNPLAEPTLIGLSSGATLGTIAVIASGAATYGSNTNAASAVLFAVIAALLVQLFAPNKGYGFLLTGIAISAILTAVAGLLIAVSQKPGIQSLSFWNFGSLTLLNNQTLRVIAPFIEVGAILSFFVSRRLDAYSLGESSSHYIGINPKRLRILAIIAMAFLIGASVSAVGSIAFLGLLVPHIVRLLVGPAHRQMLTFSAIIGSTLLLLADLLARTLFQPHEIPLGLITSLIGAPALIILLRTQKSQWVAND
jgi:iron complex transport system permease protein